MENRKNSLIMDARTDAAKAVAGRLGRAGLLCITAVPTLAVVFIIFFITKEALPFFDNLAHLKEFFTGTDWSPSKEANPHFGALSIFYGTLMVTAGSCAVAVPLGILTAVCLNEIVGGKTAQIFKPVVELLAAIPSVAYGFFAIVVFAPILQTRGGALLSAAILLAGVPLALIFGLAFGAGISGRLFKKAGARAAFDAAFTAAGLALVCAAAYRVSFVEISSGTNALNASVILAVMALPTIVSISQSREAKRS